MTNIIISSQLDHKFQRVVIVGLLAATAFLPVNSVIAADWHLNPNFRVGYEYDDNARLRVSPTSLDEIHGYMIDVSANIGFATETTTFDISPRFRSRNYDEEIFDSNDGFLKFDFNHEGIKSGFRIRGKYEQESVRTAELEDADPDVDDPDEILGDDTGTSFTFGDRKRIWVLPQWSYKITERSTFATNVRYTDVDYDDLIVAAFNPYSDVRLEASISRAFSERTRGYVEVNARQYEPDDPGAAGTEDVDGIGLNIGLERGLTQTTRFRAEVGWQETEPAVGESDSHVVWDVNLVNSMETVSVMAQVKRSINGSGAGRVSARDAFNLSVKKQFSPRVEGGLAVRAYTTSRLSGDPVDVEERDYAQIRAQLGYALTRTFSVQADYRYTYIDRSTSIDNAKSNSITLWISWQPNAARASR